MEKGADFGLLGPGLALPGAGRFWRDPQGPGVQQQLGWVRPSLEQLVCPYWNRYLLAWLWGPRWDVCLWVAWVPQHRPGVMPLLGGWGFEDLRAFAALTVLKIELGSGNWVCTSTHQEGNLSLPWPRDVAVRPWACFPASLCPRVLISQVGCGGPTGWGLCPVAVLGKFPEVDWN